MLRRIFTCGGALAAFALAGCHGGGGSFGNVTPSVSATSGATVNSSLTGTNTKTTQGVVSTNGSSSTVTGTIYGGNSSQFNVNAGSGCGYVNVSTNSSTQWTYNGLTVSSGTPVTFTGTGSCGTSFTATQVTLGSSGGGSGSPNLTGTIAGVSGNTINVNGGSGCGYVNVTYSSSTPITTNGNSLSAGTTINVWGSGSCATSFTASSIVLGSYSGSSGGGAGSPNLSGTIAGVSGNTINVNGGSGCGYVNVTYTSSTPIATNGYSLSAGTPIQVWGSGNCGTSFSATSISLGGSGSSGSSGGSGSPNLSGTIYAVNGNTINVNGGSGCGYVNVTYSSSTSISYNGYSLAGGTPIQVWGSGNCGTSFSATTISLGGSGSGGSGGSGGSSGNSGGSGGSSSMTHVLTSDYLGGYAGTSAISWSSAAPYLSWAEVSIQDASNVSAQGIKTMEYVDPFEQSPTDPLYTSDSSTFAYDCSGNRIPVPYEAGQWLMSPASSDLESILNNWQNNQESQGHVDAFFYDNIDDLYGLTTLPCGANQSSWDSENSSFISSSAHPVVFNGYGMNSDAEALISNSKVTGAMVEDCYGQRSGGPTVPYQSGSTWAGNENLELNAANVGKLFFCYNTPISDASQSTAVRQYIYASFLLTFSPSSSVLWEYFSTPSGFHVFPESKLVPLNPLAGEASDVSSYARGGVYVREYANCYLAGSSIGHCAAVVNPSGNSYSMPSMSQSYSHAMSISGYGVLDGGSVSVSAGAPGSIGAYGGVILVQ